MPATKTVNKAETKKVTRAASETRYDRQQLRTTKNDLPASTRREVVALLNQRLAGAIDLQAQAKQAHWNVTGPSFISLHELFDQVYTAVGGHVDLLAERIAQLGGTAEGTISIAAERSTLPDYPIGLTRGAQHVAALSDSLSAFGRVMRLGIDEMDELGDANSADLMTQVSRDIDKWLWFVEAHLES